MLLLADDSPPTAGSGDPWRVVLAETGSDDSEISLWSDHFGIEAFLSDHNSLVQSAVIGGSYINETSFTYNLNRDGVWQTDPNPVISYGPTPPPFPLTYTVHVVFKDGTTADIPFTISGYEIAEGD